MRQCSRHRVQPIAARAGDQGDTGVGEQLPIVGRGNAPIGTIRQAGDMEDIEVARRGSRVARGGEGLDAHDAAGRWVRDVGQQCVGNPLKLTGKRER